MMDILLSCSFGAITVLTTPVFAGDLVTLYTPFTKISVPPGQTITYNIQAINESDELQKFDLSVYSVSGSWSFDLKSGNYRVKQLAVLP